MPFVAKIKTVSKEWIETLRPGLAGKITLWYVALLILTVFLLSSLTFWGNRQALLKEKQQVLENTVLQILATLDDRSEGQAMNIHDPDVLSGNIPKEVTVQLSSPSDSLIQRAGQLKSQLPIQKQSALELKVLNGEDYYYVAKPIQSGGKTVGYLQAVIGLGEVNLAQKVLFKQLLWIGGSALLLAAVGGLVLSRQVLSPLAHLNREISNLTAHDLNRRLPVSGNDDELDRLAQSFNQMMERLETSFQKQQQFVANASHELRTPLMVIRGHADILKRWGSEDPLLVRDSAESVGVEVEMMTKLVENLLTLAREDLRLNLATINLEELIIDSTAGLPYLQKLRVEYDLASDVNIQGDALYLRQLLRVIMENAGKYVPEGGKIQIKLRSEGTGVTIVIEDNGPGIPPESLDAIFDRFYRVDAARSRNVPGHGLGLSIARKIVEAHHGNIRAENVVPQGVRFWIVFGV